MGERSISTAVHEWAALLSLAPAEPALHTTPHEECRMLPMNAFAAAAMVCALTSSVALAGQPDQTIPARFAGSISAALGPGGMTLDARIDQAAPDAPGVDGPTVACTLPVTIYQNTLNFSGVALPQSGLTLWDDLEPVDDGGTLLTSISFTIANLGTSGVYTGGLVRVRFAPIIDDFGLGDPVATIDFQLDEIFAGQLALQPGSFVFASFFGIQLTNEIFLPEERYFVGLTFLEAGGAQNVGVLGQALYAPPSVGQSTDGMRFGGGTLTFGGSPQASVGWRIAVIAPPPADYTFHRITLPGGGVLVESTHSAINNHDQVALVFEQNNQAQLFLGSIDSNRVHTIAQASSASIVRTPSIDDNNLAFYALPFVQPGGIRAGYAVPIDAGAAFRVTDGPNLFAAPFLFGTATGGMAGAIDISGDGGGHLLVYYDGINPPSPVQVTATDNGTNPASDLADIDFFAISGNKLGQSAALVTLVSGGQQIRRYNPDGSGFTVLGSNLAADPGSPVLSFQLQSPVGINNNDEGVFLGRTLDNKSAIFRYQNGQTDILFGPEQLAGVGLSDNFALPSQSLFLSDTGKFAFVGRPSNTSWFSLWVGTLDGSIEQIVNPNCPITDTAGQQHTLTTLFTIEPAINDAGTIVFVGRDLNTNERIAFIATPIATTTPCIGDLNNDNTVDADDLGILLASFGCQIACDSDLTGDGVVDADDLGALLAAFGRSCESLLE